MHYKNLFIIDQFGIRINCPFRVNFVRGEIIECNIYIYISATERANYPEESHGVVKPRDV